MHFIKRHPSRGFLEKFLENLQNFSVTHSAEKLFLVNAALNLQKEHKIYFPGIFSNYFWNADLQSICA